MNSIIIKLHDILNLIKGFGVGYSSKSLSQGKMLIEYDGKRYCLELREIKCPSKTFLDDVRNLQYY